MHCLSEFFRGKRPHCSGPTIDLPSLGIALTVDLCLVATKTSRPADTNTRRHAPIIQIHL